MNVLKECRYGLMLYNKNDAYIGKSLQDYGEYSEEEVDLFKGILKPGNIAIDLGANMGALTIPLAKIVGPKGMVFAYEPQRIPYYTLCANVAINNLENVYCFQNAVGNRDGRVEIPELNFNKDQNFGELQLGKHYSGAKSSCSVRMIRLDTLNLPRLDLIKMDIEGMEPEALLGAKELINKHRPYLYMEADRHENMSLVVKIVRGLNYKIEFHSPLLYSPNNFDRNDYNQFGNTCSVNMFCTPAEKTSTIDPDDYRLMPLNPDGRVMLKTTEQNIKQVYDMTVKEVATSCLKAAHYYSDKLWKHNQALSFTEFALRTNPHDIDSYHYAAQVFCRMHNYEEALKLLDAALAEEETPHLMFTRGAVLGGLGRFEESIEQYREALEIDPKNPNIHFNMACALLATEQYEEGWKEYDWRFKVIGVKQFLRVLPDLPLWDEKPLKGRKLLLFTEQGAGDVIQFIRYVDYLKGGTVAVACQRHVEPILRGYPGIDRFVVFNSDDGSTIPAEDFDCMLSLLSLARVFKDIPKKSSYLTPHRENWTAPCKFDKKELKVGIAWAGNEMHENDHNRSCHLKEFLMLQDIPGIRWYSLQKGNMKRTWETLGPTHLMENTDNIKLEDHTDTFKDLNDTANFIDNLDLVITVDTGVAHLAAAMGKPTWMLLGFYPDHRWLLDRTDTPWYPSMKIFRNPAGEENWPKIFQSVKKELAKTVKAHQMQ